MNCLLCNKELYSTFGIESYSCPTKLLVVPVYSELSHYCLFKGWNGIWTHIAYILKYRITTDCNHSVVAKYDDNGYVRQILDTRDLNIEPLKMQSEKDMLRRIETLLVFS